MQYPRTIPEKGGRHHRKLVADLLHRSAFHGGDARERQSRTVGIAATKLPSTVINKVPKVYSDLPTEKGRNTVPSVLPRHTKIPQTRRPFILRDDGAARVLSLALSENSLLHKQLRVFTKEEIHDVGFIG